MTGAADSGRIAVKPALLAGRVEYEVGATSITQFAKGGRENWRVNYADLTSLNFVIHKLHGQRMRRLDLITPDGKWSISLNISMRIGRADPDRTAIRAVHSALADALYAARPDLHIVMGEQGFYRWMMFVIGALMVIGGTGFIIAGLMDGGALDRSLELAIPAVLLVLLGGYNAYNHLPWRDQATLPMQVFATMMAADAAPTEKAGKPGG